MAAKRLWYSVFIFAAFLGLLAVVPAQGDNNDSDGLSAREAELLADFLILAVKPEGDDRDYKLVEIGDTKINAGLLGVVVNTLPLDFLGLGPEKRDYDEAAELAQCRAACRANAACRDFDYVRPNANQPVGVCHLKRPASHAVMTPVADTEDRSARPIREPAADQASGATMVFEGRDTAGRARYGEGARVSPVTIKFDEPVSTAKVFISAAVITGERTRATVEAFDAKGQSIETTGAWISVGGEMNFGHAVAVGRGDSDRIKTIRITSSKPGTLQLDGVEYVRTLIAPPVIAEKSPKPETPREKIPPPPRLPPITVEYFPLPPRAVPTAPPTDITVPVAAVEPPVDPVVETPAPTPVEAPPVAQPVAAVPPAAVAPVRKRGLPLWLALGAIAAMFAGAAAYWRNHRARTMNRLTTRLVSNGLDRQSIAVEGADDHGHSLRVVVRAPANANARIELVPRGAVA